MVGWCVCVFVLIYAICFFLIDTNSFHLLFYDQFNGMFGDEFGRVAWPSTVECAYVWSGWSGISYALPILLVRMSNLDKFTFGMQGLLSIQADYNFCNSPSVFHGIDRCFAVYNLCRCIQVVCHYSTRQEFFKILVSFLPVAFSGMSSRHSKIHENWDGWIFWHGLWHIFGGLSETLVFRITAFQDTLISTAVNNVTKELVIEDRVPARSAAAERRAADTRREAGAATASGNF